MAGNQRKTSKKEDKPHILNTKDNPLTNVQREHIANLAKSKLTSSKLYSNLWPTQQALALESILFKFIRAHYDYEVITKKIDEETEREYFVFRHSYQIPGLEKEKDMSIEFTIEVEKKYLENKKW